jgi:hypothetical protein
VPEHDESALSIDRSQLVVARQGALYTAAIPAHGPAQLSRVIDVPRRYYYRQLVHAGTHAVGFVEARDEGRAYVELVDLAGKRKTTVFEAPKPKAVDWTHGARYVPARRSVVFATGLGDTEPGSLYALSLDDGKVRKLADNIHDLFDTSTDGKWALVAVEPDHDSLRGRVELLGLVDLETGKVVSRIPVPVEPADAIVDLRDARFVSK